MPRAVIVGGARTPFVRAFTHFTELDTIALGVHAVQGAFERTGVPADALQAVCWGGVILPAGAPNVGREIVLDAGLPRTAEARTTSRACASGLQAVADAVHLIERGEAEVVIAGGSDSTSNASLVMPETLIRKVGPVVMGSKAGAMDYLKLLGKLSFRRDLMPGQPRVAERSTGELMGEACERMVEIWKVSREDQDAFALASHQRAAAARDWYADDLVEVAGVREDGLVRGDSTLEKLGRLRPVFTDDGTLTAGNSSALTDGAAAVVLMSEEAAARYGQTPLAAFSSWSWVGVDPAEQLLIGPAIAMPRALARAGLTLADMDVLEMHEAFAAQVLCVLEALDSADFAAERGLSGPMGRISTDVLNKKGGSLSLGHPFGATGARMVLGTARQLQKGQRGLLGICAAGGLGAAAVLEGV